MTRSTIRTLLFSTLLFTVASAAWAAKSKGQVALGWAFVTTWFGMVALVSGVIWYLVRLDRRTAGIAESLTELNRMLAAGFRSREPDA